MVCGVLVGMVVLLASGRGTVGHSLKLNVSCHGRTQEEVLLEAPGLLWCDVVMMLTDWKKWSCYSQCFGARSN